MKKILVTIGTGSFNSLIRCLDIKYSNFEIFFQTGASKYIPSHGDYSEKIVNISSKYNKFDLIITHAGAGTVYNLLEQKLKFIVVPNIERPDKHQLEIAKFLKKKNLCKVISIAEIEEIDIENLFSELLKIKFNDYSKTKFFKTYEIKDFLLNK